MGCCEVDSGFNGKRRGFFGFFFYVVKYVWVVRLRIFFSNRRDY